MDQKLSHYNYISYYYQLNLASSLSDECLTAWLENLYPLHLTYVHYLVMLPETKV